MQVALDGRIVSGEANVSTEHITGEAVPVRKGTGDELPSGARVEDGALVVKATRPASESTIARIAQLSSQAKVVQSSLAMYHALLLMQTCVQGPDAYIGMAQRLQMVHLAR